MTLQLDLVKMCSDGFIEMFSGGSIRVKTNWRRALLLPLAAAVGV